MVGEPKYVPAELYWFLNELLKKTKNDVVIAGWKALFGKDLNPTQIRYLKNKYGNDDVYNAPLSNKRLAYKWPEEAHQLCPGYKRDQRPDADTAEAHRLLAEKLLPYGVEANLCPEYPSTDYMRKVESEGTPYHGPHLPIGSITFGRALRDGPPAPNRGRQQSDAGPSSSASRPGSAYMSQSYPGSSRLATASGTNSLARPGSSSNPYPSIENVRAVPSARSGIKHESTQPGISTLNAPLGSGVQQQQQPGQARGQHIRQVDARQQQQHGQQGMSRPRQLTQAQYQQIMAARAVRDARALGLGQSQQGGQHLTESQMMHLRAQQTQRIQQVQQAGPTGSHETQQTYQGVAQGQMFMTQQAQPISQARPYPLVQVAETGAVLVESDGNLVWSPSHVRTQASNRAPTAVTAQAPHQFPGAGVFSARQPTRQPSGMVSEDEGEVSDSAKRKRPLSPELEPESSKRTRIDPASEVSDDGAPASSINQQPPRHVAVPRDPNKSHPLPNERPRTGILEPSRQDGRRPSIAAASTGGQTTQESTSVAAVTDMQFDDFIDFGLHEPFPSVNPPPFLETGAIPHDASHFPKPEVDPFAMMPAPTNTYDASLHADARSTCRTQASTAGERRRRTANYDQIPGSSPTSRNERSVPDGRRYMHSQDQSMTGPVTPKPTEQDLSSTTFTPSARPHYPDPSQANMMQQVSGTLNAYPASLMGTNLQMGQGQGHSHVRNLSTSSTTSAQSRPQARMGGDTLEFYKACNARQSLSRGHVQTSMGPPPVPPRGRSQQRTMGTPRRQTNRNVQFSSKAILPQSPAANMLPTIHEDQQPQEGPRGSVQGRQQGIQGLHTQGHNTRSLGAGHKYAPVESPVVTYSGFEFDDELFGQASKDMAVEPLTDIPATPSEQAPSMTEQAGQSSPLHQEPENRLNWIQNTTSSDILAQEGTGVLAAFQYSSSPRAAFAQTTSQSTPRQVQELRQAERLERPHATEPEIIEISSDTEPGDRKGKGRAVAEGAGDVQAHVPGVPNEDLFLPWDAYDDELLRLLSGGGKGAAEDPLGLYVAVPPDGEGVSHHPGVAEYPADPALTGAQDLSMSTYLGATPTLSIEDNLGSFGPVQAFQEEPATIDPSILGQGALSEPPIDFTSFPALDIPVDDGLFDELDNYDFSLPAIPTGNSGANTAALSAGDSAAHWEDVLQNLSAAVNNEDTIEEAEEAGPSTDPLSTSSANPMISGEQAAINLGQASASKEKIIKSKDGADDEDEDDGGSQPFSLFVGSIDWDLWDSLG